MTWALAATYGGDADPAAALTWVGSGDVRPVAAGRMTVAAHRAIELGPVLCAIAGSIYAVGGERPGQDLPVALAADWRKRGDRILAGLRGDFAIVLYDAEREIATIARDHMGGMPLWWTSTGPTLLASTDPSVLVRMLGRTPSPDPVSLAHWIGVGGIAPRRSMFEGVARVEAGCLLALEDGRWTERRHWQPRYRRPERVSREAAAEGLGARLSNAVARRLEPDAAVMLSGGLDSSTVAAHAARTAQPPARAYSAVFPGLPSVDEDALIEEIAAATGLQRTNAVVRGGSVIAGAIPYLERFGMPPVSPNLFFWNPLLERARADGTSALLDGEGGDELFGLSPMLAADLIRRGRLIAARRLMDRIPGAHGHATREQMKRYARRFVIPGLVPAPVHSLAERLRSHERYSPPYLRPHARVAFAETVDPAAWKRAPGPAWWAWLIDAVTQGMGPAMGHEHVALRARMHGIAARHPLIDVDVIEHILALPPELAYDPERSRPLLRATTAGLLPDAVRLRPGKSNFDAIFHAGLGGPDLPAVRSLLDARARVWATADRERFDAAYLTPGPPPPERPGARMHWAIPVWRAVTAELWLRSLEDPTEPRRWAEAEGLAPPDLEVVAT